jgi:protein-tyrosine phosphatase
MIDLHCHILPGIDDGPRTLEDAVAMCRAAAASGTQALVATSHQRRSSWWNTDRRALRRLRRQLQAALGPAPRIYGGGEVHVDTSLLSEVMEFSRDALEGLLPLADSRYLLLEFSAQANGEEAADLIHELSVAGWIPVLAHPEHIHWLATDPDLVAHLVSLGATMQITAMSVTGHFGHRAQTHSHRLLDLGLVHFVASDTHDLKNRPPTLQPARTLIAEHWGESIAKDLLEVNPRAVLENRPLAAHDETASASALRDARR